MNNEEGDNSRKFWLKKTLRITSNEAWRTKTGEEEWNNNISERKEVHSEVQKVKFNEA